MSKVWATHRGGPVMLLAAALFTPPPLVAQTPSHFPDPIFHDGTEGVSAGPFRDDDAARFLAQATFGPTTADIVHLRSLVASNGGAGYQAWLDEQFAAPQTLMMDYYNWVAGLGESVGYKTINEAWLRGALGGFDAVVHDGSTKNTDQLRQRVAFALSEIFVISDQNTMLDQSPRGQAYFYDVLVKNAFGNFRQLLEDVTLSPAMGIYLSSVANDRPDLASNRHPDENYAREVNQLFSIGLVMLNNDGTPIMSGGKPIPTYDQSVITNFAHVFTGWDFANCATSSNWGCYQHDGDFNVPMVAWPSHHDDGTKTNTGDFLNKQLLSYTNAQGGGLLIGNNAGAFANTPQNDLDFALDNIFNHPNVGPFIGKQLIQRLVTSNPSPAYVNRVATVFNNDGNNVRGNLQAVVQAILLDPEARFGQFWNSTTFGKLREPDLRVTHLWRAMNAIEHCADPSFLNGDYSTYPTRYAGHWTGNNIMDFRYGQGVGQSVMNAPSVFNFFRPDFLPSGEMTGLGLHGPEFQINTDTLISNTANALFEETLHYDQTDACGGLYYGADGQLAINRSADAGLSTSALLDKYNLIFMSGQMSPFLRQTLSDYMAAVGGTPIQNVSTVLMLLLTSPEYVIQK